MSDRRLVEPRIADGLAMPRRIGAIFALSFGTTVIAIDGGIPNVALPTIAHSLGIAPSAAVLIVTVYQLVLVMTMLPLAALGDRIGHRKIYLGGLAIFAAGSMVVLFAKSLPMLLAVRAFQAIGAAGMLGVMAAMVRGIYPSRGLGRGLGINSVVVTSASTLAPTIGGIVIGHAPWPWIFAAAMPFALAALAMGRLLPAPEPRPGPYDIKGALLFATTFFLVFAGIESATHGGPLAVSAIVTFVGIGFGIVFVRRELRSETPILPVDLLKRPPLALAASGSQFAYIALMLLLLSMPFRLQHGYGFSSTEVGAMISAWPMSMIIAAPLAGTMADRYPASILGGIGMTVAVGALLLLAWLPAHPSHFDLVWRLALSGLGFGFFLSPNARMIIGAAPRERAAAAGGLIATNRFAGQTLGATLTAILLALGLGDGSVPMLVAAGLAALAGLLSVVRLHPGFVA